MINPYASASLRRWLRCISMISQAQMINVRVIRLPPRHSAKHSETDAGITDDHKVEARHHGYSSLQNVSVGHHCGLGHLIKEKCDQDGGNAGQEFCARTDHGPGTAHPAPPFLSTSQHALSRIKTLALVQNNAGRIRTFWRIEDNPTSIIGTTGVRSEYC